MPLFPDVRFDSQQTPKLHLPCEPWVVRGGSCPEAWASLPKMPPLYWELNPSQCSHACTVLYAGPGPVQKIGLTLLSRRLHSSAGDNQNAYHKYLPKDMSLGAGIVV